MLQHVQGIQWRGVSKPAHHCQLRVVFHSPVCQEVWIKLLSYERSHESLLCTAIFASSSLVARASSTHFFSGFLYIRDEKLQQKRIWLLKTAHSPNTLAVAAPCSYQKGDILTHTTPIQTHCRTLTLNKKPTSPNNIFVLLCKVIFYNENSNCYHIEANVSPTPSPRSFNTWYLIQ